MYGEPWALYAGARPKRTLEGNSAIPVRKGYAGWQGMQSKPQLGAEY